MNLWLAWDFPAWSVCKKIRYCCFSHSASIATDGPGSVHETPLFPLPSLRFPSACSLLFCLSCEAVSSNGRVCERECTVCAHVWLSVRIHMNVCVPQVFFRWCRINWGSHMCVETVWGLVVSCPPTLDFLPPPLVHLIIFPLPFPTAAPVPVYHPFFVYSIEDVWLNILRPAESSWFSNFSCPVCQRKTKACAKYIWMRSLNLSELTFYFSAFLVSITSSLLPSPLFSLCLLSPTLLLWPVSKDL